MQAKTGIGNRALRPLLGLVDPLHTLTMPERVTAFSGWVVVCVPRFSSREKQTSSLRVNNLPVSMLRNISRTIIFQNKDAEWLNILLGLMCCAMPWSPSRLSITLSAPLAPPIPCYALLTKVQIRYLMCGQNMPWESLTSTSSGLSTTQTILRPDHKCIWPLPSQVSSILTSKEMLDYCFFNLSDFLSSYYSCSLTLGQKYSI